MFLGISLVLRLTLTFALARIVSPDQLGVYSWSVTAFGIMSIVTSFGLEFFLIRKIPEFRNIQKNRVGSVIGHTQKQVKIHSLLCIAIILPISYFSKFFFEGATQYNSELMVIILALPFAGYLSSYSTSLRALDFPLTGQVLESILQTGILLFMVLISLTVFSDSFSGDVRAFQLVGMFLISWILSCIIANHSFRMRIKVQSYLEPSKKDIKEWRKDQFTIVSGILGWASLGRSDILLLAFLVSSSEVAAYFICIRIAEILMFFSSVSYYVWGGELSNLIQKNCLKQAQDALRKSSQLCIATTLIATCLAWAFAEEMLAFFNETYVEHVHIFRVALLIFFLKGSAGILNRMYYILGEQAFLAKVQWSLGLFLTACVLLTVPIYGLMGCIISLAICEVTYFTIMATRLKIKFNFSISPIPVNFCFKSTGQIK